MGFRQLSAGFTGLQASRLAAFPAFTGLQAFRPAAFLPTLAGKEKCLSAASRQERQRVLQTLVIVHGEGLIQQKRQILSS